MSHFSSLSRQVGKCICGLHQENGIGLNAWPLTVRESGGSIMLWGGGAFCWRGLGPLVSTEGSNLFWVITCNISIYRRGLPSICSAQGGHWLVWWVWQSCESYATLKTWKKNYIDIVCVCVTCVCMCVCVLRGLKYCWGYERSAVSPRPYSNRRWLKAVSAFCVCLPRSLQQASVSVYWRERAN